MKTMKKLASLLLALAMIFTLATTAFAVDGDDEGNDTPPTKYDSITITKAKPGETYNLYKLFDLIVNDEYAPTGYSYRVNSNWADFFAEGGAGNQYVTISDGGYVTAISDAAALAKAAANWENKPAVTKSVTVPNDGSTASFTDLVDGYWLITSSLGTVAMTETTPANSDVTIEEKNPEDTIEKKVQEDSTLAWGDENDAQIGDTVNFKSTATLNPHTTNVKIHDTMDAGLDYNEDVKIFIDENCQTELADGNYSVLGTPDQGDTFTIQFTGTYLASLTAQTKLYLTYSAVLNEKAIVTTPTTDIQNQLNKTKITYGDAQSVEDSTTTTTHKFSVFKHATDDTDNLAGAVFSLKKDGTVVKLIKIDDTNYRVANGNETGAVETFTTVAKGDIVIWGVDADDDYALEETDAPEGYNKLPADVPVTVDAGNGTRIDVENNSGTELPSTGGMGTTLFYVLGGILFTAAVVLLVTKKRMAN